MCEINKCDNYNERHKIDTFIFCLVHTLILIVYYSHTLITLKEKNCKKDTKLNSHSTTIFFLDKTTIC